MTWIIAIRYSFLLPMNPQHLPGPEKRVGRDFIAAGRDPNRLIVLDMEASKFG